MARKTKPRRRNVLLVAAMVVLTSGGAAFIWVRSRRPPDVIAEATLAYARGEFDRAASLSHRRLRQVRDDPRALLIAARRRAPGPGSEGHCAL